MYTVFLAGGIASGKSTVARLLEGRGAVRIDLDQLSREATSAGSATNLLIAQEFGSDVLDSEGGLERALLASRAFVSPDRTRALEKIVHPAIRQLLKAALAAQELAGTAVCVVEVPLLDRVEDLLGMANEVLCVTCPREVRRRRAQGRGMSAQDFDARVAQQTTEDYLVAHATHTIRNDGDEEALRALVDQWWDTVASRVSSREG